MQFNEYSANGRTLMVKFTCSRCGTELTEELEKHADDTAESYGYLHRINPPAGWQDLLHGPLLCERCYTKYLRFMDNTLGG